MQVNSTGGAWFGTDFTTPVDLTGKTDFLYDLKTTTTGTSTMVALKFGAAGTWCQFNGNNVNAGTITTIDVQLANLGCTSPDLSQLVGIYVWFSSGTFYIDNVRVE